MVKNSKQAYREYLQSDTWQTLKAEATKQAGGRCQLCNSSEKLHVHHRVYPETWGTESVSDLTVLCNSCHFIFHFKKPATNQEAGPSIQIPVQTAIDDRISFAAKGWLVHMAAASGLPEWLDFVDQHTEQIQAFASTYPDRDTLEENLEGYMQELENFGYVEKREDLFHFITNPVSFSIQDKIKGLKTLFNTVH